MPSQTQSTTLSTKRDIAQAEKQIVKAKEKHFASHAKSVEKSLAVSVKDFSDFAHNSDFWSSEYTEARIETLVRLDKAMGRISLHIAHKLGEDLIQLQLFTDRGDWKQRVLALRMDYRRAVRYMLIARVFPYVDHFEKFLGIESVSRALDACKLAKDNGFLTSGVGGPHCDSSRYGDLKEKLAESDVDPKTYGKSEQQFLSVTSSESAEATDGKGATDTQSETKDSSDDGLSYDDVCDALRVVGKTLMQLSSEVRNWTDIADAGPASRRSLSLQLKCIQDQVNEIITKIGEPSDAAPPIECDTSDDEVTDDTKVALTVINDGADNA